MKLRILTRRPGRRPAALLSAAAVAAAGLFAAAAPAGAAITLGPDRADGLPAYIVDSQGVAIAPCDGPLRGICGGGAFDPADPGYWDAGATVGPLKAVWSVSSPAGGRITRFTGSSLAPGRYKIQDPWGTVNCQADAGGKMDCRLPGRRITTLLRSLSAPAGFVGNPNVNRPVTGSPTGFNKVVVTGPAGFKASTSRFAITGQMLASTPMSSVNKTAMSLGRPHNAAPVTRTVRYSSFGTANALPTVRLGGANPGAFTVKNTCGSVAPGSSCAIDVTFRPRQHLNKTVKANLVINDNGLAAPRTVKLTGVGLAR